jgi:hypothetical protein
MVKFVVMAMEPKIMIFDSATSLSFCTLPLPNILALAGRGAKFGHVSYKVHRRSFFLAGRHEN